MFERVDGIVASFSALAAFVPYKIRAATGLRFMLNYLIMDGLLQPLPDDPKTLKVDGSPVIEVYELTEQGKRLVEQWKQGLPLV